MATSHAKHWLEDPILPATLLAVGLHLIVIFGVGFELEKFRTTRASTVTFALTPSTEIPDSAQHIAQENQQGESESDVAPELFASATLSIKQTESNRDRAYSSESAVVPHTDPATHRQRDTLARQADTNTRAGAVAARRALDAAYLLQWRRRVEQIGNRLYRQATARYGSGDVRLLVVVSADGTLKRSKVITSSGIPELDEAAMTTVRRAAPFPPFSDALRSEVSSLEIVRTWQFRRQGESGQN